MPALSLQSILIWAAAPILQSLCIFALYRRNLLNQFRFFASFLAFQVIKNGVLFLCYHYSSQQSWTYYASYWVGTAMADMFKIAVLYEIFCAAFKPFAGLQDLAKVVFKWAAASIFLVGFIVFVTNPSSQAIKYSWLINGVYNFERIVRVIESALLMFLYLGSQHLGVGKRNRVFGFALGFGIDAFCQLLVYTAMTNAHVSKLHSLAQLPPVVYFVSLVIWVA